MALTVLGYPPLRNSFLNEVGKVAAALSLQTQKKSARRSERLNAETKSPASGGAEEKP
jgi:hypothetical protein